MRKNLKVLGSAAEWVGRGSNGGQGQVMVDRGGNDNSLKNIWVDQAGRQNNGSTPSKFFRVI